jgi:hypothetical protein
MYPDLCMRLSDRASSRRNSEETAKNCLTVIGWSKMYRHSETIKVEDLSGTKFEGPLLRHSKQAPKAGKTTRTSVSASFVLCIAVLPDIRHHLLLLARRLSVRISP